MQQQQQRQPDSSGGESEGMAAAQPARADGFDWLDGQADADLLGWIRTPPDDLAVAPQLRAHRQQITANVGLFQAAVARRLYAPHNGRAAAEGVKRRRLDRPARSPLEPLPAGSIRVAKLTSGCDVLDSVLRGGFPCGALTEIAGEASCGKTQICLQLLLAAQLPRYLGGLEGR